MACTGESILVVIFDDDCEKGLDECWEAWKDDVDEVFGDVLGSFAGSIEAMLSAAPIYQKERLFLQLSVQHSLFTKCVGFTFPALTTKRKTHSQKKPQPFQYRHILGSAFSLHEI